jgi:GNAT superfamily N-acetyltransferase
MEGITIRRGTLEDLPHILHQRRAMFAEIGAEESRLDSMQDASAAYFREAIPQGNYLAWMAETADGRIVASGGIALVPWPGSPDFPATRRGWILGIFTEPAFRRRGIALRVMETIVEWCRGAGFDYVSLHASNDGRAVYEKMGFRPTNEMRLYLTSRSGG